MPARSLAVPARRRRKASTAVQVASAVWPGDERGLEDRSRKPSAPSALKRSTHLATVFGVVLNGRTAGAFLSPPRTAARTCGDEVLAKAATSAGKIGGQATS